MRGAVVKLVVVAALVGGCAGGDDDIVVSPDPVLDAADFVAVFEKAGIPIGDVVVWDEDSDPNSLLGRPGQYVAKATWTDDRAEPCADGEPGWECGGDVELFASDGARDRRFDYLSGFATQSLIGGFYLWKAEHAVVRVGFALTPSAAGGYEQAMRNAGMTVEPLDADALPEPSARDLDDACDAAVDELVAYVSRQADAVDADPSALNDPDLYGESHGYGERFGAECALGFDQAVTSLLTRLGDEHDRRSGASRLLVEVTLGALCEEFGAGLDVAACSTGATTPPPPTAPPPTTATPSTTVPPPTTTTTDSGLTPSQRQAVRSAESYLAVMPFSRQGLIDQLSSEYGGKFPVADATAAVDSLNVDWFAQAERAAQSYLDVMGFSCQGLIDQLSSQYGGQFTREEATYGVTQVGIC